MELTRDKIEWLAKQPVISEVVEMRTGEVVDIAKQLLAEMDKPKVWENAPEWATKATVNWSAPTHYSGVYKEYTRELPKTRIDEIADEAVDKYKRGAVGAGSLTDIIKSAILKDREERYVGR
jgi:hypothetical protein